MNHPPALSVVIPTRGHAASLRRTIESLADQDAATADFEVVVVFDGPDPAGVTALAGLKSRLALRIIQRAPENAAAARNAGAAAARADLLLFLDDDVVAAPSLISAHLAAQSAHGPLVGVGRLTFKAVRRSGLVDYLGDWWRSHDARLSAAPESAGATDAFAGNLCLPREWFAATGGFDATFSRPDDVEFGLRLEARGYRFRYVAGAAARQDYDRSPRQVLDNARREGRGAVAVTERHPAALGRLRLGSFGREGRAAALAARFVGPATLLEPVLRVLDPLVSRTRLSARWHRTRYATWYWRGVRDASRGLWRDLVSPPVVLMYHGFTDAGDETRFVTGARRLRGQLAWIRRRGYPVLTATALATMRANGQRPPRNAVVLTFDDAYVDAVDIGLPIASRHQLAPTIFVPTALLGGTFDGHAVVSGQVIRGLAQAAVDLGAHSRTHPRLVDMSLADAADEVAGSRRDLAALSGRDVQVFAYPYGAHRGRSGLARDAGFRAAFTTTPAPVAPGHEDMELPRYEIPGGLPLVWFAVLLWLRQPGALPGTRTNSR